MTKKYSTKRALVASLLSLVLCFSMLVGTTFAWFTDSVTSADNKIVAGNLDVQLWMYNGTEYAEITESSAPIFGSGATASANTGATLWEPGKTQTVYLKVVNNGTLDLKYKIVLNVSEIEKDLNNVLSYKISDGVNADTGVGAKWSEVPGAETAISDGQQIVSLDGVAVDYKLNNKSEHLFALSVHMDENAGNEYKEGSITFDISVLATQIDSESDSFDNKYDAGLDAMANGVYRTLADGSTVFHYDEESGYAGRVRLNALPENLGSEYVVPAEVNDLGGALAGVDLDKLTIPAGVVNAYKSLQGATIDEIVIEDGATTIPNRMFYQTNVKRVVIPSSVTVIEQNAFAMATAVEELVIPASVTTVEEAAFQHMTDLKTVTFEGNTAIQGYAFRGCAALRTVYLNGDDVTFITSTLNGRDNCWFCNGESNNPGTSNISFYVKNATVAERVLTAMGAEAANTPVYID